MSGASFLLGLDVMALLFESRALVLGTAGRGAKGDEAEIEEDP